ncbi:MAG: GIY-YIG nuclease family protein [Cryomorphaceae bacterium]|nr:MAG: GIY-YIG nuclease family protein [Cryomorphaceae bacterium]
METWFVYVLYSEKFGRYYTGMAQNPDRRLKEHNKGKTKSTKAFRPWEIIHKEQLNSRPEARQREKFLKSGVGREYIKGLRSLTG